MTAEVLRFSAFTRDGRGGNPAGVVLDATSLTDADMLAIAADLGYSETAFVLPGQGGHHDIRYFSPRAEVPFCGHATVATGVALAERDGPGVLELTTPAGPVRVRTRATSTGFTATLVSPPASTRPAAPAAVSTTLETFGWDLADLDPAYPPHVASAGNDHLLLAAARLKRLAALDYDYPALERLMAEQGWTTVHVFWAETPTLFHARDPFPPGGVVEDPATGAAAAAFGGYLRALGLVEVPGEVTVLQGHHMGRPSRLLIGLDAGTDRVRVTGHATQLRQV